MVPLLTLASPGFLKIAGVAPSWAVLWLLPWALVDGPASGAIAGLCLGLVLDGLHLGLASEVPVLMLLGWWWGRIGRRGVPIERSYNLGLLAVLGSALLGASLFLQLYWAGQLPLVEAGLHTLVAQSLITGLLAPVLCSLMLLRWRRIADLRS
jgi:rod shape-determining protein MreD